MKVTLYTYARLVSGIVLLILPTAECIYQQHPLGSSQVKVIYYTSSIKKVYHFYWKIFLQKVIGFTLLYLKMAVMPLVPVTKNADVGKLVNLGNLLARKTTWLVLTTTPATSILTRVFGAYCMTRIVYKYSHLPTLFLFHIFTYRVNTLFPVWLPARTLSLSQFWLTVNTLCLFFTVDFQQSTATKMYTLCNHSLPCYTLSVKLFPVSNTEISSNHRKKQTVEILSQHA